MDMGPVAPPSAHFLLQQPVVTSLAAMTLGEAYLKDILRTPPTSHLPEPTLHPFQKSFYTYLTKKALPKHWYLIAGATFMLTSYGVLDGLRDSGKKSAYDAAVLAGQKPYKEGGH